MKKSIKPIYKAISSRLKAMQNCQKSGNIEWFNKHREAIEEIMKGSPSGSGIDSGTNFDIDNSTSEKLIFYFDYHHMNENGFYDGWTSHKLIVTASLQFGINLKITGRDRNRIKEYLYDVYHEWIKSNCEE